MKNVLHKRFPSAAALAAKLRIDIVQMISASGSSHIGSALSAADILAVLYYSWLSYDPSVPDDDSRDRLIFSKGHGGSCLYAVLAEAGFFPVTELETYCRNNSHLSGHVNSHGVPGVEFSTGALGHGLPVAAGIALSLKLRKNPAKTVVIIGDGECDEGSIWESALFAAAHKLDNLTVIIDRNRMQALGNTEDILPLEPLADKWQSFNWHTQKINGHDCGQLLDALNSGSHGKPKCIIADTVKGKGVSFMENQLLWHYRTPTGELLEKALDELTGDKK
jgi:transketolase